MNFASFPVICYLLPAFALLTAFSGEKWKRDALAFGGLFYVWVAGGCTALLLMLASAGCAWLQIRLSPRKEGGHHRRAELWLYAGIAIQAVLLLICRMQIGGMQMLPLLICALQSVECMSEHANNRLKIPPLHAFLCYSFDLTRLPCGPVLSFPESEQIRENRAVTAEKIGQGASLCIRGLFQLICLSLPLAQLHGQIASGGSVRTVLDALALMAVFYLMLYYRLKGTAQIGQGLAKMLGYDLPDSFDSPVTAGSVRQFWARFLVPMHDWVKRVLLPPQSAQDAAGFFARTALLFGGIGLLFGRGGCGLLWGAGMALLLTAEKYRKRRILPRSFPAAGRRLLTAVVILLGMGMLGSRSIFDGVACYGALLGIDGIPFSDQTGYLLRTNWFVIAVSAAGLFPLKQLVPEGKARVRIIRSACVYAAEAVMLLLAYSELLSRYLRP